MSTLAITDALALFEDLQRAQLDCWAAALDPDLRWIELVKKKAKLKRFTECDTGDIIELLSRPRKAGDDWYAKHGARVVGARHVYAAQTGTIPEPAVVLYTSGFFDPGRLTTRFVIAELPEGLQLVSRYERVDGGWSYAGGREVHPASTGALQRLKETPDEGSEAMLRKLE